MSGSRPAEFFDYMEKAECFPPELIGYMKQHDFGKQPASTKWHGAYPGGLWEHSLNMARVLRELTNNLELKWQRAESPEIIGYLHDLCKIDIYKSIEKPEGNIHYQHCNPELPFGGHGARSVMLIQRFMKLTDEEIMCIRYHMGAFIPEDVPDLDQAIKLYPNVIWTHTADMVASQVLEK